MFFYHLSLSLNAFPVGRSRPGVFLAPPIIADWPAGVVTLCLLLPIGLTLVPTQWGKVKVNKKDIFDKNFDNPPIYDKLWMTYLHPECIVEGVTDLCPFTL